MSSNSSTQKVQAVLKAQAKKLQSRWRKAITGSSTKRVRDHIREVQEVPKNVKLLDKVGFTLGVLNVLVCQYFLLNVPQYFSTWYAFVLPITMLSRFYHFKSLNFHYFLIDFCYFTIFNTLLNISVLRWSGRFFKMCFIFSTGVLPIAIPVWRNSFIFHDFDKIVSVYIHILPCMLYYTLRWNSFSDEGHMVCGLSDLASCEPLYLSDYFYALLIYCFWQAAYLLKTEVMDKAKFDAHPEILTSLRWLAKDTKNDFARMTLKILRRLCIFGPQEEFDSTTLKTKLVFVACQLLLTLVSFIPTPLFYYSPLAHFLWIALIFTVSVFNGASFYIDVFSVRYQAQLKKMDEMQKIAREAASMMQQMAADMNLPPSKRSVVDGNLSPKPPRSPVRPVGIATAPASTASTTTAAAAPPSTTAPLPADETTPSKDTDADTDELDLSEDESLRHLLDEIGSLDYDLLEPE